MLADRMRAHSVNHDADLVTAYTMFFDLRLIHAMKLRANYHREYEEAVP